NMRSTNIRSEAGWAPGAAADLFTPVPPVYPTSAPQVWAAAYRRTSACSRSTVRKQVILACSRTSRMVSDSQFISFNFNKLGYVKLFGYQLAQKCGQGELQQWAM